MEDSGSRQSDIYVDYQEIGVDPKQSAIRIDKFLGDRLSNVSRNRIQNAIRSGSILVNGQDVKPNYRVRPGDNIQMVLPKPPDESRATEPEYIPLNVVYEDEDVLLINKQPGLVVHPGVGHRRGTLVNGLVHYFNTQDLPVLPGNSHNRVGLVHRIDKNTSGLLLIAKTEYAMSHLAKQFFYHTIERKYYALVWGDVAEDSGTITGYIGRNPRHPQQRMVMEDDEGGKWAATHFRVLERMYYVTLVECQLETGRTHQIRVHMKHLGHTLFNDDLYGGDTILKGTVYSKYRQFVEKCFEIMPRHGLHAGVLGFEHPTTGKWMYFESALPPDFSGCLEAWRGYVDKKGGG